MELSPAESKAYAMWLDEQNADRDLDDQEARASERFLRRQVVRKILDFCSGFVLFCSLRFGYVRFDISVYLGTLTLLGGKGISQGFGIISFPFNLPSKG